MPMKNISDQRSCILVSTNGRFSGLNDDFKEKKCISLGIAMETGDGIIQTGVVNPPFDHGRMVGYCTFSCSLSL